MNDMSILLKGPEIWLPSCSEDSGVVSWGIFAILLSAFLAYYCEKMNDDTQHDEGSPQEPSLDDLKAKIAEAQEQDAAETEAMNELESALQAQKEAEDRALRAMAELKNAQQRMENEKNQFAAFATQGVVLRVLEIYENYHRLLQHRPDASADVSNDPASTGGQNPMSKEVQEWVKGLELIDQQFSGFLEQQGVTVIEVKAGDQIDPEKHEAMMTGEGNPGEILEVFSQGYEMKGRVIKTAKVKVGKAVGA